MILLDIVPQNFPHGKELKMFAFISMKDMKRSLRTFEYKIVIEVYLVLLDKFKKKIAKFFQVHWSLRQISSAPIIILEKLQPLD